MNKKSWVDYHRVSENTSDLIQSVINAAFESVAHKRKPKFASDDDEIAWLMEQGRGEKGCCFDNLTLEQRARWIELTDRPFPDYAIFVR